MLLPFIEDWRIARARRRVRLLEREAQSSPAAFRALRKIASGDPVDKARREIAGEAIGRHVMRRMREEGLTR